MNNVVNFLLDYYIWILVVLIVIIITIIGFLVDSKQKRTKVETNNNDKDEVKTLEPLPNINGQNNTSTMEVANEMTINSNRMNGEINQETMNIQTNPIVEEPNNINQVDLTSNRLNDLNPQNMTLGNITPTNNVEEMIVPQPISAVSINKPIEPVVNRVETPIAPNINVNATYANTTSEIAKPEPIGINFDNQYVAPTVPVQNTVETPSYTQPMNEIAKPEPVGINFDNQYVAPTVPVQNTVETPSYTQPISEVAKPEPIVMDFNNQVQPTIPVKNTVETPSYTQPMNEIAKPEPVGINFDNQVQPTIPVQNQVVSNSQVEQNQPNTTTIPNFGMNFVTGETNQTENDNWKL